MKEIEVTKITLIVNEFAGGIGRGWGGFFVRLSFQLLVQVFVFDVGFVECSTRGINCEVASFYWLCLNSRRVPVKTTTSCSDVLTSPSFHMKPSSFWPSQISYSCITSFRTMVTLTNFVTIYKEIFKRVT